ncbi:MAG: NAD-dependent epimerase/dehydratase family protein [bacterium]|nr:NAD-dependent epimerase/dehydratase family protein [bacterium]
MANVLLIGGSGFVSGTTATEALSQGHRVWAVTRGKRPLPKGVTPVTVDRSDRDAFARTIADLKLTWDLVIDGIGYDVEDAEQDIAVFRDKTRHLVFISTDFVFDPAHRTFPQAEESDHYLSDTYGGKKRLCELALINGDTGEMNWSVVRPCHIYGPGSKLGCLPNHGRDEHLIDHLRAGKALELIGGGHFLQQPILARDLARLMLSLHGKPKTYGQIFQAAGPDIIESREYYHIIADILGVDRPEIIELPVGEYLKEFPARAPFCCHRIYSLGKLISAGAAAPSTPIALGLKEHVESLLMSV